MDKSVKDDIPYEDEFDWSQPHFIIKNEYGEAEWVSEIPSDPDSYIYYEERQREKAVREAL
jgi:hypothetical protein